MPDHLRDMTCTWTDMISLTHIRLEHTKWKHHSVTPTHHVVLLLQVLNTGNEDMWNTKKQKQHKSEVAK
jgi:hypothetical protein